MDEFGEKFIEIARDYSCANIQRILFGESTNDEEAKFSSQVKMFSESQLAIISDLMRFALDEGLGNALWFFEDSKRSIFFTDSNGDTHNISEVSDGLCGELWTESGWIQRFSEFRNGIKPDSTSSSTTS